MPSKIEKINILLLLTITALIVGFAVFYFTIDKVCAADVSCTPTIPLPTIPYTSPTMSPTPTGSPSATPTVTPPVSLQSSTTGGSGNNGNSGGQSNNAPSAPVCDHPFASPDLLTITAGQSGQLTLTWSETDTSVDKYSITYGFVGQSLNMGADNIPSTSRSFTISDLPSGAYINAQIQAWQNDCEESSNILDPRVN